MTIPGSITAGMRLQDHVRSLGLLTGFRPRPELDDFSRDCFLPDPAQHRLKLIKFAGDLAACRCHGFQRAWFSAAKA